MRKILFAIVLIWSAGIFAQVQAEKTGGQIFDGYTSAVLNGLSTKPNGLLVRNSTVNTLWYWNGTEFKDLLAGGSSYVFSTGLTNTSGTITVNNATIAPSWVNVTSKPTIDAVPTNGSTNAVQSDGVFDALNLKANTSALGSLAYLSTVASANITDGTIVNGDINASAGIELSKLQVATANTFPFFGASGYLVSTNASTFRGSLGLGSAAVAALIDDDTFGTASATNIPSAESVKAYVDANAGGSTDGLVSFDETKSSTVQIRIKDGDILEDYILEVDTTAVASPIEWDEVPTNGSTKAVRSNGIFDALANLTEGGTFTPTMTDSGGGATYSFTNQSSYYRIGDLVYVEFFLTNINSTGSATGNYTFTLGDLPSGLNPTYDGGTFTIGLALGVLDSDETKSYYVSKDGSDIRFYRLSGSFGIGSTPVSARTVSSGSVRFEGVYVR